MDLIGSDFLLRGRSMERSLNCSRFITTSPQLFRTKTRAFHDNDIKSENTLLILHWRGMSPCVPVNSPPTRYGVLHLKLHVDRDGAGVDPWGIHLICQACVLGLLPDWRLILPALIDLLHILLQLIQTLTQKLMGILNKDICLECASRVLSAQNREVISLTFCIYPEKRSAVEEMAFFTRRKRSFFTSGDELSFLASRWAKRLHRKTKHNQMIEQLHWDDTLLTMFSNENTKTVTS